MSFLRLIFISFIVCFTSVGLVNATSLHDMLRPVTDVAEDNLHTILIVDAGSTGSRAYIYQYSDTPANQMPGFFRESFGDGDGNKVKPGLATFGETPEEAVAYLSPIIDKALASLPQKYIGKSIDLFIYSTGGMRLIPDYQRNAINQELYDGLRANYPQFRNGRVVIRTISGQDEGLYAWLTANFLTSTLGAKQEDTVGIAEMGGASAQVAFASDVPTENTISFRIGGQRYHLFSHSFLGMGHTSAAHGIPDRPSCYPTDYPMPDAMTGAFDFSGCTNAIISYLDNMGVRDALEPLPEGMTFYGLSGFYYTFRDFHVTPSNIGLFSLLNRIEHECVEQDWRALQNMFKDQIPAKYLGEHCFVGVYDLVVLERYFGFDYTGHDLSITKKINNLEASWTLGAALEAATGFEIEDRYTIQ